MPRVLNVGQCGFDHASIARQFVKSFGADVVGASTFDEAVKTLRSKPFDLVLVNRVTDADSSSGLALIQTLKADPELSGIPVMLVSNYPEAQKQAETLGALVGFGKADLTSATALERIRAALVVPEPKS